MSGYLPGTASLVEEIDSVLNAAPGCTSETTCAVSPCAGKDVVMQGSQHKTLPDEKLLVVLRDGRTLIGYLRSIDQFANLVLHRTIERIHVGKKYGDIPRGIFIVRGENVVLLGEVDTENEKNLPLEEVSIDVILDMQREMQIAKEQEEERKRKALQERGMHFTEQPEDFM